MGKISDIWVRLGLKKNEFDRGMDDAAKKTEKTGGKMTNMLSKVKAGWLAIGATVMAFGREMIQATNRAGDAWNNTLAGVRSGWQSVLADISNYKPDFSSFRNFIKGEWKWIKDTFGNAGEAYSAGKAMAKAFDAEFELENSLKIQRARISGELADLQVEMRNTALSPEQRKAATERYRALLEPLYQAEIATRKNMLDEAVKAWLAGTGVTASTQEVSDFFANYGINPEAAAAASPELARVYETRKGDKANQPIFDAITKLAVAEGGLANELKLVNRTANIIDKAIADGKIDLGALNEAMMEDFSDDLELDDELPPIEAPDIDTSSLDKYEERLKKFVEEYNATQAELAHLNGMLESSIVSAMSNGMQAITDLMFGLEGADASQVLASILSPFADTMTQLGSMLIAEGIAIKAFKKALTDLDPAVAIGAGVALLAIGAALKSGIQKLGANAGSGGASSSSYTGGSPSASATAQNYKSEQVIYVKGKISGSDIVIAGDNQRNKWNR